MESVIGDLTSDNWSTIRIRTELKQTIEKDALPRKKHGVPIYNSVADFVHAACITELERLKKKGVAA